MRWWTKTTRCCISLALCAATALAGPVELATAELNAAIDARNFKYKPKFMAELNLDPPGSFRIDTYAAGGAHITGGDLRGLMYGLFEAAQQMRSTGRLKLTKGSPSLTLRGVRIAANPSAAWFLSTDFWRGYFLQMAHARFNRLELSFDPAPSQQIQPTLASIALMGQSYGVDVAVGFASPAIPPIEATLKSCATVKAIVLHAEPLVETPMLLQVLHDSGRRVVLELPSSENSAALIANLASSGAPLRWFAPYTPEIVNPQPLNAYWEMDPSQGEAAVSGISGAGFEVNSPVDSNGQPVLDNIVAWGLDGYTRPAPAH